MTFWCPATNVHLIFFYFFCIVLNLNPTLHMWLYLWFSSDHFISKCVELSLLSLEQIGWCWQFNWLGRKKPPKNSKLFGLNVSLLNCQMTVVCLQWQWRLFHRMDLNFAQWKGKQLTAYVLFFSSWPCWMRDNNQKPYSKNIKNNHRKNAWKVNFILFFVMTTYSETLVWFSSNPLLPNVLRISPSILANSSA